MPFSSPGDRPNPGIEPGSPTLQADALPSEPPGNLYHFVRQRGTQWTPASEKLCPNWERIVRRFYSNGSKGITSLWTFF